jgi:prepilin-type N-terminal cleavage/methylation domain-containing protein
MNRRHDRPGFTLIEMLIAMAIIATIVSMVYGSYAATSRSLEVYDRRLTCAQRTDLILRLMARQLRCAYGRPDEPNTADSNDAPGNPTMDQASRKLSQARELRVSKRRPAFLGGASGAGRDVLDFITTGGLAGEADGLGGLTRIRYRHDSHQRTLAVCSGPYIESIRDDRPGDVWQTLSRQVVTVKIEFYDGRQWQTKWNSEPSRLLPRAVRLTLTAIDEKGRVYESGTTVEILSQTAKRNESGQMP